jgi:integrase
MAENLLSEKTVRAAKPDTKAYKMGDGKGMYLLVQPSGTKCWRLKYQLDGKEKLLALGVFDDVGLALARDRRDEARKLIARGIDPVVAKRREREAKNERARYTFEKAAEAFVAHNTKAWSESHRRDVGRIVDEINETLGDKSMAGIEPEDVEKVIDKIEKRGALTYARDVRMYFRAIVRHFNAKNRKHRIADPSADILIATAPRVRHHAALDPGEIGGFLRALRNSNAAPLVRLAVRLLIATGVRTTELRLARWSEIDTKAKLWRIPAERMKAHREHLVPLARPVLELLDELRLITGEGDLLFPHLFEPDQPISDGTIINAIKYGCGYRGRATGHGMRRTFSTWANEQGFHPDAIERQLAHVEGNTVRAAYNAAEHLPERKRLMAAWADFLEETERGAKVVALHERQVKA